MNKERWRVGISGPDFKVEAREWLADTGATAAIEAFAAALEMARPSLPGGVWTILEGLLRDRCEFHPEDFDAPSQFRDAVYDLLFPSATDADPQPPDGSEVSAKSKN